MHLRCKLLAALLAGAAAGAFCEVNRVSDEARERQAVDVPDYEPGIDNLLAEIDEHLRAADEHDAQPTAEFDLLAVWRKVMGLDVDPLAGRERFTGDEDVIA